MIVATAVASIGLFLVVLALSGIFSVAAGVLTTTQNAMATMRNTHLDDAARQAAMQRASLRLLSDVGSILARGAISLAAGSLPVLLVDYAGLASFAEVFDFLSRWDVVLISSGVMVFACLIRIRLWPSG